MPEWTEAPEVNLNDALSEVMYELNDEIKDGPSFEEVAGIPLDSLSKNAASAVGTFMRTNDITDPSCWVQIYTLGFLVGAKYGSKHPVDRSHERKTE